MNLGLFRLLATNFKTCANVQFARSRVILDKNFSGNILHHGKISITLIWKPNRVIRAVLYVGVRLNY